MDMFHALAEPQRRKVVEMLVRKGQMSATQICKNFTITPQAMSQHLKVLREADVIIMDRDAQRRLYSINPEAIVELGEWVKGMEQLWNERLDRLDIVLKKEKQRNARRK